MSMEEFFCEWLELDIRLPAELFDKDAFLEDVKDNIPDKSRDIYGWSYGSLEKPSKQHAHIIVDLRTADNYRLIITYHGFGGEEEDIRPPYMEDCAQWLGGFIKGNEVSVDLSASYTFDKSYSSVLALPFPLLTPNKELAGSRVTGVRIQLPRQFDAKTAILQRGKQQTTLYLDSKIKIDLKQFDLKTQLQKLSNTVMKLIIRTGENQ